MPDLVRNQTPGQLLSSLRPSLLRFLLREEEFVILLDPEVQLFRGLADVSDVAASHEIVLVPMVLGPVPLDGHAPTEPDLQELGIHNAGLLAVGRGAGDFLDWHSAHLRQESVADVAQGTALDQRWLDFVPAYFEHHVSRDSSLGLGPWNLHERRVVEVDGEYLVDGNPLGFFNFRGFDPAQPDALTTHAFRSGRPMRSGVGDQPGVVHLRNAYAESLLRYG